MKKTLIVIKKSLDVICRPLLALTLVWTSNLYADPKVDEQIVGPSVSDAKYVVSPQGGHLATVARKGSRMMVTMDGVDGAKVDDVVTPVGWVDPRFAQAISAAGQQSPVLQPVTFSKDGGHFAYIARIGQEWVVMEDNKEVLRLPAAGLVGGTAGVGGMAGNTDLRLQFSDDGKHLFFSKSGYAGFELWVDGQKMPGYYASAGGGAQTTDPLIYAGGAHFAYVAKMGTRPGDPQALIVDGKDAGYLATDLQATSDGHLVGTERTKDGVQLVMDGKSLFKAREIFAAYVAPVGQRIAVVLRHAYPNGSFGQFLLVDGKPAEATLGEQIKRVVFSPDGKRYAAVCGRAGAEFVVVDGKKGQEYQSIDTFVVGLSMGLGFSPDSSRVAYVANAQAKKFIVIDDDESDAYDSVALFSFMPEGRGVVTYGRQGPSMRLNVNGKALSLPMNAGVQFDTFTWSPDRSRYAFISGYNPNSGGAVYLDGKDTGLTGRFIFSPDSKHVAVVGSHPADNKSGIFVDNTLVFTVVQNLGHCAFSPDSQHLFWMSLEPMKTPGPTDAFEWVTYADGKPVLHNDRSAPSQALLFPQGFAKFTSLPPAWNVRSDGSLHILASSPDGIKHVTATPGSDTSLTALVEAAAKTPKK
jgi:hypothetical protein